MLLLNSDLYKLFNHKQNKTWQVKRLKGLRIKFHCNMICLQNDLTRNKILSGLLMNNAFKITLRGKRGFNHTFIYIRLPVWNRCTKFEFDPGFFEYKHPNIRRKKNVLAY